MFTNLKYNNNAVVRDASGSGQSVSFLKYPRVLSRVPVDIPIFEYSKIWNLIYIATSANGYMYIYTAQSRDRFFINWSFLYFRHAEYTIRAASGD